MFYSISYYLYFLAENNVNNSTSGLESINVITNALTPRSVSLREMMRRATAAVRTSGNPFLYYLNSALLHLLLISRTIPLWTHRWVYCMFFISGLLAHMLIFKMSLSDHFY